MYMVNVKGNLQKMLKIIERSKAVRVFLYFAITAGLIAELIFLIPSILKVIYHG